MPDHRAEMSAVTQLFAGVPVSDLDASIDWYTRFFGRPLELPACYTFATTSRTSTLSRVTDSETICGT